MMDPYFFHPDRHSNVEGIDIKAGQYFGNPDTKRVDLNELHSANEDDRPDFYYLYARLIVQKTCEPEKKYTKNDKKMKGKTIMIIMEEIVEEGKPFYLFLNEEEFNVSTMHLHLKCRRGMPCLLMNVLPGSEYKNTDTLVLRKPIFPLHRLPQAFHLRSQDPIDRPISNNLPAIIENQIKRAR